MIKLLFCTGAFMTLTAAFWFDSLFAPDATVWQKWTKHNSVSIKRIDHGPWDQILKIYVRPGPDEINRFAYSRLSAGDLSRLHNYILHLTDIPISTYNRFEQLAYWINLYNALTIQVVSIHFPVASIRDIDLGGNNFSRTPWRRKLIAVEGEEISLDDIEHRILRPIWQDPRIHYAINCASVGSPNLRREAYNGNTVNRVLESAARKFVNNPRAVTFEGQDLIISSIYVWFAKDFGGTDEMIISHIKRYAGPTLKEALGRTARIDGHHYDWRLNDTNFLPNQ